MAYFNGHIAYFNGHMAYFNRHLYIGHIAYFTVHVAYFNRHLYIGERANILDGSIVECYLIMRRKQFPRVIQVKEAAPNDSRTQDLYLPSRGRVGAG